MVFCNVHHTQQIIGFGESHNPYFNRWFSAMAKRGQKNIWFGVTILILIDGFLQSYKVRKNRTKKHCHNPYFNRWFSAMMMKDECHARYIRHNPYFNRWFSAIQNDDYEVVAMFKSQSLF